MMIKIKWIFKIQTTAKKFPFLQLFLWDVSSSVSFRGGGFRDVVVNVMDCNIVVREFELQSCYYIYLRTNTLGNGVNLLISPAVG